MELDRRMKTATPQFRPAIVFGLAACLTLAFGVLPVSLSAQETGRTLATGSGIALTPDAPEQYVVKPGDTLWDISKVYLRDPWYWPEIWYVNPQVANPHLIYPGDVLRLVYIDGQPRLTIAERAEGGTGGKRLSPQIRREPLSHAITAVPYDVIAGFIGRPTLLGKDQVKSAPYVVAMRDEHMIGAPGNEIYARGINGAEPDARYSIIHVDGKLRDPDTNDLLGYTGIYVGSGPLLAAGDPAKLMLAESSREALQGDKLFPESVEAGVDFVPHAPTADVNAKVIAVRDMTVMGQYHVIALNRGSKAGLEPGHVLAINQRGSVVRDRYSNGGLDSGMGAGLKFGKSVQLPAERSGIAMVYKTFDEMSFALIMEATHEIHEGDLAQNP
jgi:nucleoid-associated protein YgaU